MNNMRNKILMTLALLIAAVGGAWAEETPLVTITFDSNGPVYSVEGLVTLTGTNYNTGSTSGVYYWSPNSPTKTLSATVEAVADNVSISKVVFWGLGADYAYPLEDTEKPFVCYSNYDHGGRSLSETDWTNIKSSERIAKIDVYAASSAEPTIDVTPVAGKTNEWTFAMPAYDVEIAPIYAPVAQWAKVENVDQIPAAIEGIFAGTTDAIVKAGTVVEGQGIVMYAVTSTNQAKAPALTAFSADLPTAKDIADEGADVLVWYYIKGADTPQGETATAENTFNDSEICAEPIEVKILSNKFDIQFNAANANTIEAGKATVKVGETAAEVKEGKLTGVKMGSKVTVTAKEGYKFRKVEVKNNEKKLTIGDITLDITGCTTWQQVADKNSTLISAFSNMIWNASTSKNLKKGDSYVRPDDPVDPTATDYQFVSGHS
jgi:hypothetical protein